MNNLHVVIIFALEYGTFAVETEALELCAFHEFHDDIFK